MKNAIALLMMLGTLCLPVRTALDVGDAAPNFTVPAALGGKVFQYTLAEQLAKGPVVLYFFPAAFSDGCSRDARSVRVRIESSCMGTLPFTASKEPSRDMVNFIMFEPSCWISLALSAKGVS